jgi:hypothetical protein
MMNSLGDDSINMGIQAMQTQQPDVKGYFITQTNQLKDLINENLTGQSKKEDISAYFQYDFMLKAIQNTQNDDNKFLFEILFTFFKAQLKQVEAACQKKKKLLQEVKKFIAKVEKEKATFFDPVQVQPKPVKKTEEKPDQRKLKKLKKLTEPAYSESNFELADQNNQPFMGAPQDSLESSLTVSQMPSLTATNQALNSNIVANLVPQNQYTETANTNMSGGDGMYDDYKDYGDGPNSIALTRPKRNLKKPQYTYTPHLVDDKQKAAKRIRKEKLTKLEPPSYKPPLENKGIINREEIANSWRDWELHFNSLLSTLSEDEFRLFIMKVESLHPECISFDSGYLELKIEACKLNPIGLDDKTRINNIRNQLQTYQMFSQYINEVKESKRNKGEQDSNGMDVNIEETQNIAKGEYKTDNVKDNGDMYYGNHEMKDEMDYKDQIYGGIFDNGEFGEDNYTYNG